MANAADTRRRWLGVGFLALAAAMLICGQTFLAPKLVRLGFLFYWLACFLFTVAAITLALADLRALRRRTREAHRELVRETFGNVPEPPDPSGREDHSG